jgi:hypothetical protein
LRGGASGARPELLYACAYSPDGFERLFAAKQIRLGAHERLEFVENAERFIVRHAIWVQTEHDVFGLPGHAECDADNPELIDVRVSLHAPDLIIVLFDSARAAISRSEEGANRTFEVLNERTHGSLLS